MSDPTFAPAWSASAPRLVSARLRDTIRLSDHSAFDPSAAADMSSIILGAVDALPSRGGRIWFPAGEIRVESTLLVQKHNVEFEAEGGPGFGDFDAPGACELHWHGPAQNDFIRVGNKPGEHVVGFGMRNLQLNGHGLTLANLRFTDAQRMTVDRCFLREAGTVGLLLDNGTAEAHPCGWGQFRDLQIYQVAEGASGHGIWLNGSGTTGVSMMDFIGLRMRHHDGDGVRFNQGDGYTFIRPFIFGSGVGRSIHYPDYLAVDAAVAGLWVHPVVSHMHVAPDFSQGRTTVTVIDWPIGDGQPMPGGPGARSINIVTADGLRGQGRARQKWNYTDVIDDTMALIRFDAANDVVQTAKGNWRSVRSGGGSVDDAGQPGGAITLQSGSGYTTMIGAPVGGGGYHKNSNIDDFFILSPLSTDCCIRAGLFEDIAEDTFGGVYFVAHPSLGPNWKAVSKACGIGTVVDTNIPVGIGKRQFRISVFSDVVRFYSRADASQKWTIVGEISINLPGLGLAPAFQVQSLGGGNKQLMLFHRHTTVDVE